MASKPKSMKIKTRSRSMKSRIPLSIKTHKRLTQHAKACGEFVYETAERLLSNALDKAGK